MALQDAGVADASGETDVPADALIVASTEASSDVAALAETLADGFISVGAGVAVGVTSVSSVLAPSTYT